jgi:hypothetical protein
VAECHKVFHFGFYHQKNLPNYCPELFFFKSGSYFGTFFEDLSHSEKLSDIRPPIKAV